MVGEGFAGFVPPACDPGGRATRLDGSMTARRPRRHCVLPGAVALLVAAGCATGETTHPTRSGASVPEATPRASAVGESVPPAVASSAPPSPSPTPASASVVPVPARGPVGRRTWHLPSVGHPATACLARAAAVEQSATGAWFLVRADGRPSLLSVPAVVVPALRAGCLTVTWPGSSAVVTETSPLVTARWVSRDGVRSLRVEPAKPVRDWATPVAVAALWAEVLHDVDGAGVPGMRDQFACHAQFAPAKAAWYLEPDRPAVGWPATVAAGCNPGDVRDGG